MLQGVKRIDTKTSESMRAHPDNITAQRTYYNSFEQKFPWLKIQDIIIYTMLMHTYKLCYNIAPSYLCELVNKNESHVNTRLGTDHHQHIIPPINKDCSNTFLELSFIYATLCEWYRLSEYIRKANVIVPRRVLKQCHLHTNMDADCKQQCLYHLYYCYLCFHHC